jgi:hypothetical protein
MLNLALILKFHYEVFSKWYFEYGLRLGRIRDLLYGKRVVSVDFCENTLNGDGWLARKGLKNQ